MKVIVVALSIVAAAFAWPDTIYVPSPGYLPAGRQNYNYESSQSNEVKAKGGGGFQAVTGVSNLGGVGGQPKMQDQKHIYFYAAPEEPTTTKLRVLVEPQSKKNTKIIFIKAPHFAGVVPEIVAPPSLSEDKTLVYVLSKNSEIAPITIPAGFGIQQAKPQVFFIKYNNKNEAEGYINRGLQGQQVGNNVPNLANQGLFINLLDSINVQGSTSSKSQGQAGSSGTTAHQGTRGSASLYRPVGPSGPY